MRHPVQLDTLTWEMLKAITSKTRKFKVNLELDSRPLKRDEFVNNLILQIYQQLSKQ